MMDEGDGATRTLLRTTAEGTLAQLAMVVAGHYIAAIAALFGILGVSISLAVGAVYALRAGGGGGGGVSDDAAAAAGGGAVAGGACALIGIVVSFLLGDVAAAVVAFGTLASAVTGALGGLLGRRLAARRERRPA